ncbi:hypothetical protein B5F09_13230 [Erysipelatoclostridium sp. An173]|uniref:hypothetical protein n=1 Tax=Erysipelatoclostridium sp. An173 TaxID=1965571 RepID=UPI000B3A7796|nr:hypothetical protein [Erysipelatoclostridium sp. An173]OUP72088.1 hypothetical protein B5F09_13230 [Erysipelatoclostridium sp. An173]
MILFNAIINFIESLLLVWLIADFFGFKESKNKFIFITTLIDFLILEISQFANYYGIFLSFIIMIVIIISIYIFTKSVTFKHVYIILIQNALLMIYIVISVYICDLFTFKDTYIIECILCKILQLFGNIILLKYKDKLALTLEITKWKVVIVFEVILLILLYSMFYRTLFSNNSAFFFELNEILLLILCIMFMYIVNLINEEHREKMQLIKDKQQEEFQRQKYYAISNVKNEIEALDHRLFYTVFKIEEYLKKQDYESIDKIIDYYKNQVLKHKLVIDTGNHVFDTLYSVKINEMVMTGIDISNIVLINKNQFYDDLGLINFIQRTLDFFRECKYLKIDISEENGFVLFKLIYRDGIVNLDELKMFLDENPWLPVMYNLDDCQIRGIRISFKMEQDDD